MLETIGGRITVDFCHLPAVFALDRTAQAPERGPGVVPGFAPRTVRQEPSFYLGQPERPLTDGLQGQCGRRHALLLCALHDSTLHKSYGIMITYDLQL